MVIWGLGDNMNTQLLCTFTTEDDLQKTIEHIQRSYEIAFNSIYVLENLDEKGVLCCTYNIVADAPIHEPVPPSTISLHRKKQTNTLYTINALNKLVEEQHGKIDPTFQVEWEQIRNTILVTQYGQLKKIPTKIQEIVRL